MTYKGELNYGGSCLVPHEVANCPECGGQLVAQSYEYEVAGGTPTIGGVVVDCDLDPDYKHRYYQSDWQPVLDAVLKWCGAVEV